MSGEEGAVPQTQQEEGQVPEQAAADGPLSFKIDLWDGYEKVIRRLQDGRDTMKHIADLLNDLGKVEQSYAQSLASVHKDHRAPPTEKGTLTEAWVNMKPRLESDSKQHQQYGDALLKLASEVLTFREEQYTQRKEIQQKEKKLKSELEIVRNAHNKAKTRYISASRQLHIAMGQLEQTESGELFTAKQKSQFQSKKESCLKDRDNAETEYKGAVERLDAAKSTYEKGIEAILQDAEMMETKRVDRIKGEFNMWALHQEALSSNVQQGVLTIQKLVESINVEGDVQQFIKSNKTGLSWPAHVAFEEYSDTPPVPAVKPKGKVENQTTEKKQKKQRRSIFGGRDKSPSKKASAPAVVSTVALYAYKAEADDELGFAEGDTIDVDRIDEGGWWHGSCNGKAGIFPANYVEAGQGKAAQAPPEEGGGAAAAAEPAASEFAGKKCKALYDWDATEGSADELSIKEGLVYTITSEAEGWYSGMDADGHVGMWPANYCELID